MVNFPESKIYPNNISCNQQGDNLYCPDTETKPVLNKFLHDNFEYNQKENKEPSFFKKLLMYPSLSFIPQIPTLFYEILLIRKLVSLKVTKNKSKDTVKVLAELGKMSRNVLIAAGTAVPIYFVMDFLNKKLKSKHQDNANKIVDNFNVKNKSDVKLISRPDDSLYIAALANPVSGQIILKNRYNEDLIYANTLQKHLLNHELVHMKQFMLMACSENGIRKLNYIVVQNIAKSLDKNGRNDVLKAYQEIKSGINDHYKNATIESFGYQINMVDYVTALYKVIYEKNTTENDIPIILNKDFYEKVKSTKGKLSEDEEKKAQIYLNAYANYPAKIDYIQAFKPKSEYRQSILEQEAYKVTPWYAR